MKKKDEFSLDTFRFSPETISKMKKAKVGVVYLFGSRVEGINTVFSDFDLGVVLQGASYLENSLPLYNELYDIFSGELPLTFSREVDIVFLQRASLELKFEVINKGRVLFEISPHFRIIFEEKITRDYLDCVHFFREYEKVTKEIFS